LRKRRTSAGRWIIQPALVLSVAFLRNEEIRRRTYVVRIFPNADACRRLVRALAVETHENWLEAHRYLNMNDLKEHKKIQLRQAA
jgi:transposase-like protein